MNMLTIKKIALGLAFTTTVIAAKAQKKYTEGSIDYSIKAGTIEGSAKSYFKGDSTSVEFSQGPVTIKLLTTVSMDYFAILVDVPVAQRKMAAVATPGEIEESADSRPSYTFTATGETKKIGDYTCQKYTAKDSKTSASYDVWVTTEITAPANIFSSAFSSLKGVPVQFPFFQTGSKVEQTVTLKSISDTKVPAGNFKIAADYTRISMSDLSAMGGRKQ